MLIVSPSDGTTDKAPLTYEDVIHLLTVLQHIHTYGFTTKSDHARNYADEIAELASRGFISTAILPGLPHYGRTWKVTVNGLTFLELLAHLIEDQEIQAYHAHVEATPVAPQ